MRSIGSLFKHFSSYLGIILLNYIYLTGFRSWELFPGIGASSFYEGWWGLAGDLLIVNSILFLFYFLYAAISAWKPTVAKAAFAAGTILIYLLGWAIQVHYLKSSEVTDARVFECSPGAALAYVYQNIVTAYYIGGSLLLAAAGILFFYYYFSVYTKISVWVSRFIIGLMVISVVVTAEMVLTSDFLSRTDQRLNKPIHFFKTSLGCYLGLYTPIADDSQSTSAYHSFYKHKEHVIPGEYPMLHRHVEDECLTGYIRKGSKNPPHIIMLVVEGLGSNLADPIHGIEFMPFLHSLKMKSLYWNHFLSPVKEGVSPFPSLLGGLPFGEKGFSELSPIPYHYSLINVLKQNGYYTSFFTGQWQWLNSNNKFLSLNRVDLVWDAAQFGTDKQKVIVDNYHWGFNDHDLFSEFLKVSAGFAVKPTFNIINAGSLRTTFAVPDEDDYKKRFNALINDLPEGEEKTLLSERSLKYISVMSTDDAIRNFFHEYEKRADYSNTLFIITGSYSSTTSANPMDQHHVPLLIYSPHLTQKAVFENISSHNDVYFSLLGYLSSAYDITVPNMAITLGNSLCSDNKSHLIPLVNEQGVLYSLIVEDKLYTAKHDAYTIGKDWQLTPVADMDDKNQLQKVFNSFQMINKTASVHLLPDSAYFDYMQMELLLDTMISKNRIRGEYFKIVDRMILSDNPHTIDVSFHKTEIPLNEVYLVFELQNEKEQTIQWKNFGIPGGQQDFTISFDIEKTDTVAPVFLQMYIWNESPLPYSLGRMKTTIYQRNN
jgi:hypothetical protein